MNRDEIMNIIPHRENMLLLDEVVKEEDVAHGYYRVKGDEFFLKGHFPGNPIVPGVILCEIMAQSACILLADEIKEGSLPVYTGLDKVKFRNSVRPGDLIETKVSIKRIKRPFFFAQGSVEVDGKRCVTADFSFALTKVGE